MRSFDPHKINTLTMPPALAWLLAQCTEARGKQDLWRQQKPEVLDALRELAIIQSAESSNRIEGVVVDAGRLEPLLVADEKPRDRPEEELVGYRNALKWVHDHHPRTVTPELVCSLHRLAQAGMISDAGVYKARNDEIIEISPSGERHVRFIPTPPEETPRAMEQLCLGYRDVLTRKQLPPLLAEAALVFDLLCIHPFRDGNGRVARLLMLLTLRNQGFHVGAYVSLERLIEQRKDAYYEALASSSIGWHEAQHDLQPWFGYMLSIVREAYAEMAKRVEHVDGAGGKQALVRELIRRQSKPFSLNELSAQLPSVSKATIKQVLSQLRDQGELEVEGRGRGARWRRGSRSAR
jgi:Fic family protein